MFEASSLLGGMASSREIRIEQNKETSVTNRPVTPPMKFIVYQ